MVPPRPRYLPPATLLQLETFLRETASPLSVTEAVVAAVKQWIERTRSAAYPAPSGCASPVKRTGATPTCCARNCKSAPPSRRRHPLRR